MSRCRRWRIARRSTDNRNEPMTELYQPAPTPTLFSVMARAALALRRAMTIPQGSRSTKPCTTMRFRQPRRTVPRPGGGERSGGFCGPARHFPAGSLDTFGRAIGQRRRHCRRTGRIAYRIDRGAGWRRLERFHHDWKLTSSYVLICVITGLGPVTQDFGASATASRGWLDQARP